jgi:hypothetical protein
VDIAVAALEANPEAYAILHRSTRRVLLPKFPYGLYYRIVDRQAVVVGASTRNATRECGGLAGPDNNEMQLMRSASVAAAAALGR